MDIAPGRALARPARFTAHHYEAQVERIDRTPEYVETGNALNAWVGLDGRIELTQGSALDLPCEDASFDAAYLMHVGM